MFGCQPVFVVGQTKANKTGLDFDYSRITLKIPWLYRYIRRQLVFDCSRQFQLTCSFIICVALGVSHPDIAFEIAFFTPLKSCELLKVISGGTLLRYQAFYLCYI
jgi:hypothetical protein